MRDRVIISLLICTFLVGSAIAQAATLTPPGLNPGDMYQLVFVTSTTRDATSSNIADYNTFVQGVADAEWLGGGSILDGVQWKAIASTATVDARDNALVVGEVYNTGGQKVADHFADFWDSTLQIPIWFNELGDQQLSPVWTGSTPAGIADDPDPLGGTINQLPTTGNSSASDLFWIDTGINPLPINQLSIYALSEKLTVSAPVPAPATTLLFGTGLLGLMAWRARRKPSVS